jgi:hypothetical protein
MQFLPGRVLIYQLCLRASNAQFDEKEKGAVMRNVTIKAALFAAVFGMSASPAVAATGWQAGTSANGPTAMLAGHKNLTSVTLSCLASGQIGMTIKLAPKTIVPPKGKAIHIDLSSYFGSRGEAILPPTATPREFSGPIDAKLVDTLMSRASPVSDKTGGDSRVLTLSMSDDGGYSWMEQNPLTLVGAQPAIRALRDDCATRTGIAAAGFGSDEAELREAIFNMYQVYRYPIEGAPREFVHMPYSAELQRYLDRATNKGGLDYDPFCQCQDYDEKQFHMQIKNIDMQKERATASIEVGASGWMDGVPRIGMTFLKTPSGWVIDDIVDEGGSLKNESKKAKPGSWVFQ